MQPPKPTASELEILQILWAHGPSTVRDICEIMSQSKPTGYTTVLKLLQIMTAKGMVIRNEEERAHVYQAQHAANRAYAARQARRAGSGVLRECLFLL